MKLIKSVIYHFTPEQATLVWPVVGAIANELTARLTGYTCLVMLKEDSTVGLVEYYRELFSRAPTSWVYQLAKMVFKQSDYMLLIVNTAPAETETVRGQTICYN